MSETVDAEKGKSVVTETKLNTYMFGTNSICYQRPKAGYET